MSADLKKLKSLRAETEVSFSLIKKALEECDNDVECAKKKLHEWGAKKAASKADRETDQGGLFSYVHHNRKTASIVELLCETDFVSANDEFKKFGQELAMQVAFTNPKDIKELLKQEYIRDTSKTIDEYYKEITLKFGENIKISRLQRFALAE